MKRKQMFGIAKNILEERELCHAIVKNQRSLFNTIGKPLNSKRQGRTGKSIKRSKMNK